LPAVVGALIGGIILSWTCIQSYVILSVGVIVVLFFAVIQLFLAGLSLSSSDENTAAVDMSHLSTDE
jgi:hypothetical protein